MPTTRRKNGSQKTLSDLHEHTQCFLVTIHVPSPLTFLLVLDVTMTSCKNTIVLVILNFKHMQMSSRFLYTNVGRLLFFNLDNLAFCYSCPYEKCHTNLVSRVFLFSSSSFLPPPYWKTRRPWG